MKFNKKIPIIFQIFITLFIKHFFLTGGQDTWREHLTLPNILKMFNPKLTGYSTGTGEFLSSKSQLNVAFPVAADADALKQAKILVNKIRNNKNIDITKDWKMITIFFGANDICSAQCYDKEASSPNNHIAKLARAIDYLQEKLPRTFINLIPVLGKLRSHSTCTSTKVI